MSHSHSHYRRLGRLGEGAHGVVYKAERIASTASDTPISGSKRKRGEETGKAKADNDSTSSASASASASDSSSIPSLVAIKKIRLRSSSEGLSIEAVREIRLLQSLHHPNVMRIYDIFNLNQNINVVMELMDWDLEKVIKDGSIRLSLADIKCYMNQMLQAVEYIHSNWVMHRDIKPGNMLLSSSGRLVLADFGLAKHFAASDLDYSPQACTCWYRAPELLFGSQYYGSAMDIWSIGCVFGELLWRKPMFAGPESELGQLSRIFALLGTPRLTDWPGVVSLPNYTEFSPVAATPFNQLFPDLQDADCLDLLSSMLQLNPSKRITARDALKHKFFQKSPAMTPIEKLPKPKQFQDQA